ncbi:hypothetical protein D3C84_1292780 [compost metagenome]
MAFNLPPGDVSLRLGIVGIDTCQPGITQLSGQRLVLRAGEVRRYRIALSTAGLYLTPAPANR